MQTVSLSRPHDQPAWHANASRVLLCGKSFLADRTGALYWPAENTLIVADLNLSRGSYLQSENVFLPPFDTASAFEKLEESLDRYNPQRVIALGASFNETSEASLSHAQFDWLSDMVEDRDWFWVANDMKIPAQLSGRTSVASNITLSGIKFRADPVKAPVANEISGSLHPVAQISHYGHVDRGRCFVTNGMRMILPSLGNYSAGLNVLSEEFDPFLGQNGLFVWVIANGSVDPVAAGQLIEDAA